MLLRVDKPIHIDGKPMLIVKEIKTNSSRGWMKYDREDNYINDTLVDLEKHEDLIRIIPKGMYC